MNRQWSDKLVEKFNSKLFWEKPEMPVNTQELINALALICDNHNLKVSVKCSAKGGLIVGASAFVGSILLGPVGLAVGGNNF